MLKPFAPVMMDRFAHAFAEAEHFRTVHAIYGAHHLENKMADMASENESNKSRHTLTGNCEEPFHMASCTVINRFLPTEFFIAYLLFPPFTIAAVCMPLDERPPRVN